MTPETYKLDELAAKAGVSARTVRYYVQRGLLPGPTFRGKDTAYGHEHLVRLAAVRRLAEHHWPLDAIQDELSRRSLAEIEALGTGPVPPPPGPSAAVPGVPAMPIAPAPVTPITPKIPEILPGTSRVHPGAQRYERLELRPGLELHLSESATSDVRALFDALVALANAHPARR